MVVSVGRFGLVAASLGACLGLSWLAGDQLMAASMPADGPDRAEHAARAVATLRTIAAAQERFRAEARVDADGDGRGAYGFLRELAGGSLRGSSHGLAEPLLPAELRATYVNTRGHRLALDGHYFFQVWLPGPGGAPLADTGVVELGALVLIDGELAEERWCGYAWPASDVTEHDPAFHVGADGTVWQTDWDLGPHYFGADGGPDAAAAVSAGGAWSGPSGDDRPGFDGRTWLPTDL